MKKATNQSTNAVRERAQPEYRMSANKGVRGKYYQAYRAGHTVRVVGEDGSVSVQRFSLADGAIMLEPDVREYFPDSESVNAALRSLIALIPVKPARRRSNSVKA